MKRVCIVVPYDYPVPACKGGAIEFLDQILIEENENKNVFQFTVITTYDKLIEEENLSCFENTKFVFFSKSKYDGIIFFLALIMAKFFNLSVPFYPRIIPILRYVKKHREEFDYILVENGVNHLTKLISKVYPKERILCRLHWIGKGTNNKIDSSFKYLLPVSEFCNRKWSIQTGRANNSFIWSNCFDDNSFGKQVDLETKTALRARYEIKDYEVVLIFVGRIVPLKGIKELILAINKLNMENVHLLVVGGAKFAEESRTPFEREIACLLEQSRFRYHMVGYVPNNELYRYYSVCDIAVMPTRFEEVAGLVNIEAMATGTPLITTNKGGISEYVGDAAFLVEDDENFVENLSKAINYFINNPKVRQDYSKRGIERAKLYTRDVYFKRFCEIICTL
ncbi:MAG: glycosyltransferase family 4 protein [Candidatus Cloacimonas sp.]|nr:glycosyltransferase family 4 protein [Candidatus Cloacimonas sp.]